VEGLVADFKEGAREELDYKKKTYFFCNKPLQE